MSTVGAALSEASTLLAGGESPRTDAQILLAYVMACERGRLIAYPEAALTAAQIDRYRALCRERASGVPVAYLTGSAGFYGRAFQVDERVLIPRPETELLVDEALAFLREDPQRRNVFEAGVGSGAIACTIAAEIPGALVEGSDASESALEAARANAQRLGVADRCTFALADVVPANARAYDLIVANLPYIPTADLPQRPQGAGFEPRIALDGGPDGLDLYRILLAAAPRLLSAGGLLLMEAAPPTLAALSALTRGALPQAVIALRRDYAGLDRYLSVKRPSSR